MGDNARASGGPSGNPVTIIPANVVAVAVVVATLELVDIKSLNRFRREHGDEANDESKLLDWCSDSCIGSFIANLLLVLIVFVPATKAAVNGVDAPIAVMNDRKNVPRNALWLFIMVVSFVVVFQWLCPPPSPARFHLVWIGVSECLCVC